MKKTVFAALALAAALALTGCGAGTPEQAVQKASKKLAKVENFSCAMNMNLEVTAQDQTIGVYLTEQGDVIRQPVQMNLQTKISLADTASFEAQEYLQQDADGKNWFYIGLKQDDGTCSWVRQEMTEDVSKYDEAGNMGLYLTSLQNLTEAGTETIGESEAVCYTGSLTGDAIRSAMEATGMMDQLLGALGTAEKAEDLISGITDIPMKIWIARKSGMPVRYEMDLGAAMQQMMDKLLADSGEEAGAISIGKAESTVDLSNFGGVAPIEVPAEALTAETAAQTEAQAETAA